MVDVDRVVGRLCKLVQDADASAALGSSREHSQAELLTAHRLRS